MRSSKDGGWLRLRICSTCPLRQHCRGVRPGTSMATRAPPKKFWNHFSIFCVSSLRRGHANLLCIVPILSGVPKNETMLPLRAYVHAAQLRNQVMGAPWPSVDAAQDHHAATTLTGLP